MLFKEDKVARADAQYRINAIYYFSDHVFMVKQIIKSVPKANQPSRLPQKRIAPTQTQHSLRIWTEAFHLTPNGTLSHFWHTVII